MRFFGRRFAIIFRSRRRTPFLCTVLLLLLLLVGFYSLKKSKQISIENKLTTVKNIVKIATDAPANKANSGWPLDDQGRSLKTNFLVLDLNGFFGATVDEGSEVSCSSSNTTFRWTRNSDQMKNIDFLISHDAGGNFGPDSLELTNAKQQYSMAYIMESEVHSSTGEAWKKFNFRMFYNLDDSYPEPATYFDVNIHLIDLLRARTVSFEEKETSADVVWIISNCNAHNGRETFVQKLMHEIKVHSYGSCLNNKQGFTGRMIDNVDAYKKYKFVISIENSNCQDYVTEKLVKAVESGSIPIVAGQNGRPDYRRYMPDHSYINVFDYPSIKALAEDIKRIGSNKTLYESYFWYKNHKKDVEKLRTAPLNEKIREFTEVVGANSTMLVDGIVAKEKSENKVCKLLRFVRTTPWKQIAEHPRSVRADASIACLSPKSIVTHFDNPNFNLSKV